MYAKRDINYPLDSTKTLKKELSGEITFYSLPLNKIIYTQSIYLSKTVDLDLGLLVGLGRAEKYIFSQYGNLSDNVMDNYYNYMERKSQSEIESEFQTFFKSQVEPSIKGLINQYAVYLKENSQPPILVTVVSFDDKNGVKPNKILDSGEQGYIVIRVENQGKGTAYEVTPVITQEVKGFTINMPELLGSISAGKSKEVHIPVVASLDLSSGQASILVEIHEKRGYDSNKVRVSFQTAKLERPNLVIKPDIKINDGSEGFASGNGNGKIENGETVELQVFVENSGAGDAYGVKLSLTEVTPSDVEIVRGESDIGRIGVKETAKGKVVIKIPRHIQLSTLNAKFRVEEVERKAAQTEKLVSLSGGTLKPDIVVQVNWNDGASGSAKGNGNGIWETGETIEGMLTIHNRGTIPAERVEVTLQASDRRVELGQRQFQVGRIDPNQSSIPLRTIVTLPRTYDGKDVLINALVHQQDFSEVSESYRQAITLRRPELAVIQRLLNQSTGDKETIGSVTTGEETKLEIRVRNDGSLEARGVTISVGSEKPEIRVGEKKVYTIGAIPAGKVSEPVLIPLTILRRAAAGKSSITVEAQQEEFPPVKTAGVFMVREEGVEEVKVAGESVKTIRSVIPAPMATNPIVIVSHPPKGDTVQETFDLIWDEISDVTSVELQVNGELIPRQASRGIALTEKPDKGGPRRFRERIPLKPGANTITVIAYDLDNKRWEDQIQVKRLTEQGEIWAVVIGVSRYQNIRSLQYARKDAESFYGYLRENLDVPEDHIRTLYDDDVNVQSIRSTLGTWLRQRAGKNDTVFVYFAGHGAPEADTGSSDGDGFEKYLLPSTTDLNDLYGTALPMKEIAEIFSRINADRIVFIVDSCFSGATGGRTVLAANTRAALLSDQFWDRLSKGKGRVILSASRANEPSEEGEQFGGGHGAFTYYLLEGLKGAADYNQDTIVDVEELYRFLTEKVPAATKQRQTPVKKGDVEGIIAVGRVK